MNRVIAKILDLDQALFVFLNQGIQKRWLDRLFSWVTHLGGAGFTIFLSLLLIFVFDEMIRMVGIQAAVSLISSHILVQIIKILFSRRRPYIVHENTRIVLEPLKDYSFPSGHTTAIFAVMIVFALNLPLLAPLFILIASSVGFSRIYLGFHYPTDSLVGGTLGTISAYLSVMLLKM